MLDNLNILIQAPVFNLTLIIDGLMIGAVYALMAYGLALVWGVMNVKNLAQGGFVMAGGYVAWWLQSGSSVYVPFTDIMVIEHIYVHPLIGLVAAAAVLWGVGWVVFKIVVRQVLDRDLFTSLLATFGVAIVTEQVLNILFTSDTRSINLGYESWTLAGGAVTLPVQKVGAFVLAGILATALAMFMKHSRTGQAIRATAQNPRAARVMGIDTEKVYAFTYSLNAAICGASGALVAMIWLVQPFYGLAYAIRAFVIVTAAGLGNLPGVIVAGFGMGVVEQYGGFILGATYQQAIVVGLLVVVLVIRLMQAQMQREVVQ